MNPGTLSACLAAALFAAAPGASAQRAPANGMPDPLDPRAEVPPAIHESAFAGYRTAGEEGVGSWREVNEAVNRIGGWRAYAREASRPGPVEPVAPARPAGGAPVRSMPGHGAHGGAAK